MADETTATNCQEIKTPETIRWIHKTIIIKPIKSSQYWYIYILI